MDTSVYHLGRGRPKNVSQVTNDLAKLVYNRRSELGYTLRETAERSAGLLIETNIQDIERGRSVNPRGLTIAGLSRALGISGNQILEVILRIANESGSKYNEHISKRDRTDAPVATAGDIEQAWRRSRSGSDGRS